MSGEAAGTRDRPLAREDIDQRLTALANWRFEDGAITRVYRTAGWKATMMLVTTIGHLCEVAWHHPELVVSYDTVLVKLWTHTAKGITEKDFALAAKIEDVLGWRPRHETGGVLDGTPETPRHAYLRHD